MSSPQKWEFWTPCITMSNYVSFDKWLRKYHRYQDTDIPTITDIQIPIDSEAGLHWPSHQLSNSKKVDSRFLRKGLISTRSTLTLPNHSIKGRPPQPCTQETIDAMDPKENSSMGRIFPHQQTAKSQWFSLWDFYLPVKGKKKIVSYLLPSWLAGCQLSNYQWN